MTITTSPAAESVPCPSPSSDSHGAPAEAVIVHVACLECGGSGYGPDKIDGPGDVYQNKCDHCDGTGEEPEITQPMTEWPT